MEDSSNYINRIKFMINRLEVQGTKDLEQKLSEYSAEITNAELERLKPSCFALGKVTPDKPTNKSILFGYGYLSKTYHEFLAMNANIGNREPRTGWPRLSTCPLCLHLDSPLNEVHVLLICTKLNEAREKSGLSDFISKRKGRKAGAVYMDLWKEKVSMRVMIQRIEAADMMRAEFIDKLGTYH